MTTQIIIDGIPCIVDEEHSITISEFIAVLEGIKEKHGDLEVFTENDWSEFSIDPEFFEIKRDQRKVNPHLPEATDYPKRLVI